MLTKDELVNLLLSLGIPVNEGQSAVKNADTYPRIVFYEYMWDDVDSSGTNYTEVDTYQVSFFSSKPRHEKLLELRDLLREKGIRPTYYHEYVEESGKDRNYYHTYFAVEVIPNE